MDPKNKVVIITGAGGGIGSEIASAFAESGAKVSLVDLNSDNLDAVKGKVIDSGARAISIVADISREKDIARIVEETVGKFGQIDMLVNNAGIMVFKPIKEHTEGDILQTLMVNVYGTIRLTQAVLPWMLKEGKGRIVNIGSIFGSLSFPLFGIYSASKFAVRGFSEALRRELLTTGVGVTYIAPRATRTSQSQAFFDMAREVGMNFDSPKVVAKAVLEAVQKDKNDLYLGRQESFFARLNSICPYLLDRALARKGEIMKRYFNRWSSTAATDT